MQTTKRFIALLLCALLSAPTTLAQYPQRDSQTDKTVSQDVLIIIGQQQVRFTSQKAVQEMQLQIFNQAGELVHDSGVSYGPEINWPLQSADGQPLKSGLYAYTLSIKEQGAETARVRRGHFIVDRAGDREKTGDRLWITSQNESGVGVEMTVARGEESTVAGVEAPAGRIANDGGLKRDGSGRGIEGETEGAKPKQETALAAAVTGTIGQLAKFTAGGQLGDSGVTVADNGRLGIGITNPSHQLRLGSGPYWTTHGWGGSLELENGSAIGWRANTAGQRFGIGHTNTGLYIFRTNSEVGTQTAAPNYDFVINDEGKIGIGTTTPNFKLEVNDSGTAIVGRSTGSGVGVYGESWNFNGVRGVAYDANHGAVVGVHESGGYGIYGQSSGPGVVGKSLNGGPGVYGESADFNGVRGVAHNANHGAVVGVHMNGGTAVFGTSSAVGVQGESTSAGGYGGYFSNTAGGIALGVGGNLQVASTGAVVSTVRSVNERAILSLDSTINGFNYIWNLESGFAGQAGRFAIYDRTAQRERLGIGPDGVVGVDALQIRGGADFAENFDVNAAPVKATEPEIAVGPGMVVSIDPSSPGKLMLSGKAYDRRVAGIISGAGGVKPGMIMSQEGTMADGKHPVALSGRVYCWVDASNGAIEPGDLLTTSGTSGHAMKVTDANRAQGAIIGKAMTDLKEGKGLVLVLVTLQ